jgi:DNA-binding PadR family transcriptional regulator
MVDFIEGPSCLGGCDRPAPSGPHASLFLTTGAILPDRGSARAGHYHGVVVARRDVELSAGEWAVLGVIAEGPTHGFAVAQLLAPTGPLGQIWSLPRPIVYQAIKKLLQLDLITERATERSSRGPQRTILATTANGRRAVRDWLGQPVEHVREVRSLLLLKLALIDRVGGDPAALLRAQHEVLSPKLAAMQRHRDEAEGFELTVATWRLESIKAVLRFLDSVLKPAPSARRSAVGKQARKRAPAAVSRSR